MASDMRDRVTMDKIVRFTCLLLFGGCTVYAQQVLLLNSGTRIEGRYDGGKADTVYFIDEHGNRHKFKLPWQRR